MGSIMQPRAMASSFVVPQVRDSTSYNFVASWENVMYDPVLTSTADIARPEKKYSHLADLLGRGRG
jgi:hypothetical protein